MEVLYPMFSDLPIHSDNNPGIVIGLRPYRYTVVAGLVGTPMGDNLYRLQMHSATGLAGKK